VDRFAIKGPLSLNNIPLRWSGNTCESINYELLTLIKLKA
jgi:hypothetical protein